jgi:dipeptidase
MYSSNLWEVAKRNGLWKEEDGLLDFLPVYSPQRAHSAYATRRIWRIFNLVAPSHILPPNTDAYANDYPFSIKSERKLSPQDVMEIQRDHYEGTVFDLTEGVAAGPYGSPDRFDWAANGNMTFAEALSGSYERAISLFRTSYSFVAVPRPSVPDVLALLWYGQYAPSSSSYAPFYLAASTPPKPYTM